mmetsp:Transcript_2915/g.5510  ORF Transcript_2915/g.5510 Transcript_2915/m.5510 type:complete len:86 (-) Transcript_2915:384-641(-)
MCNNVGHRFEGCETNSTPLGLEVLFLRKAVLHLLLIVVHLCLLTNLSMVKHNFYCNIFLAIFDCIVLFQLISFFFFFCMSLPPKK